MSEGEGRVKEPALLAAPPRVINVGLELFAENLASQGAQVVHVRWSPPAGGNAQLAGLLDQARDADEALKGKPLQIIEEANQEALRRILAGEPILVDVVPASQAIPDLADRMILHAGPPIGWERMCGPMRGAVMGIAVFEGVGRRISTTRRRKPLPAHSCSIPTIISAQSAR